VPKGVVYALEVVQVDREDRQLAAPLGGARYLLLQPLLQRGPGVNPRQRVPECQLYIHDLMPGGPITAATPRDLEPSLVWPFSATSQPPKVVSS
jgi:hypothetical protein